MRNAKKLKGTKISVQNDYCADTLRRRKMLWESAKGDKEQKRNVSSVHNKLRIDDQFYTWDDITMSRKLLPKRPGLSPQKFGPSPQC